MLNGTRDRPMDRRALSLGQCMYVTWGNCRIPLDAATVQVELQQCWRFNVWGCISLGHKVVEEGGTGGPRDMHSGVLPWCRGACSTAAALVLSA